MGLGAGSWRRLRIEPKCGRRSGIGWCKRSSAAVAATADPPLCPGRVEAGSAARGGRRAAGGGEASPRTGGDLI